MPIVKNDKFYLLLPYAMNISRTITVLDCHLRLDAIESRLDAGAKCGPRSKPCGERCIPRRTKKGKPTQCKKATSQAAIETHKQVQATEIGRLRQEQQGKRVERKTRKVKENLGSARNATVPTKGMVKGTKVANELESFLKGKLTDLKRVGGMAVEENEVRELRRKNEQIQKETQEIIEKTKKTVDETKKIRSELRKNQVDRLERSLKQRITPTEAKTASIQKRIFETIHPRKQVKMPKGSTQRDFAQAISELLSGDKKAMEKYTVTKPPKAKKSSKRKPKK
jgi:hypothetical protein